MARDWLTVDDVIDAYFRNTKHPDVVFPSTLCSSLLHVVDRGLEELPETDYVEVIAGLGLFIARLAGNNCYFPWSVAKAADYAMGYTFVPEEGGK